MKSNRKGKRNGLSRTQIKKDTGNGKDTMNCEGIIINTTYQRKML